MLNKWQLWDEAIKLRKRGLTYKQIKKYVSVSECTLSRWCKDIKFVVDKKFQLSPTYCAQLKGAKSNQLKRKKEIKQIQEAAVSELGDLSDYELKIAGIMLYWAEGNKTVHVGISNSDPDMVSLMMKWFREICGVAEDKFRAHLHVHSGQNESKMKQYWSKITGIEMSQFGKSHVKQEGTGHKKNKLYNGTIKITVCDRNLLYKILGWINKYRKCSLRNG